jgi:hypothetical protein
MGFLEELREHSRRRQRTRVIGSAGCIGFFSGATLAGRIMIWLGWFKPSTSGIDMIDYWPGFLAGGLLLAIPASIGARLLYDHLHRD